MVPARTSAREVEKALANGIDWIARRLANPRPAARTLDLRDGGVAYYGGLTLPVSIAAMSLRSASFSVADGTFAVRYPASWPAEEVDRRLASAALRWYADETRRVVEAAIARWSAVMGVQPRGITIRNQRTLWGSCSARDSLSCNARIAMLSPELADYIVVHELAHITHHNHSAAFWKRVAEYIPEHRERRAQLNALARSLPRLG